MSAYIIYLLGVDGSGKTTVARHMEQYLKSKGYSAQRIWATLRPVLLWPIIKIAKFIFIRKHNKFTNYGEHIKVKKDGIHRFQYLFKPLFYLSLLDYYPQYLWKVVRLIGKNDYLICDRYYIDMLMERAILEGTGPERVIEWMERYGRFFRAPDLVLYLHTTPAVAMKRKTDIPSEDYLQERTHYYDGLAEKLGAYMIDGDQPLSIVFDLIEIHTDDFNRQSCILN